MNRDFLENDDLIAIDDRVGGDSVDDSKLADARGEVEGLILLVSGNLARR